MRIALINDRLNAGGAEKMLVYIANLLHKNGIDVQVIILLDKAALDHQIHPNIPVHYLNRTSRFSCKAFFGLKKLLQQVDIVHVHSRYNLRYYMVAKYFVNIAKPKIFFHEHVPSYSIDAFTKFLFSKVDAYVAVQNDMRKWAVTNKMVTNQHAFYLANTVDAPKNPIQYKNNQYKILMVGNYRPQKNHLFAVSLLAKLPNQYTIDIYGMIDDEVYYNNLQNHIHTLGLTSRVALVQGISNLYEQMGNYSFALHTSIAETGPLVLVEYLYAGLPFITYNTGDVVTIIEKQLPNFIVHSFNEAEWLKAIEQLQQKMPEHNFNNVMSEIVQENFSEANYFIQLLHIYNKIMLSK
jgi:glycosyltransferase involved in cell wall biosynthesis